MGTRTITISKEIYIDESDFREEANKQYKRLKLGHEVRLRNSYIERLHLVRKMKTARQM